MGRSRPLFVYFRSFQTIYRIKTVGFSGIRTRIVGVEGEHADHLNTTTAQIFPSYCSILCLTQKYLPLSLCVSLSLCLSLSLSLKSFSLSLSLSLKSISLFLSPNEAQKTCPAQAFVPPTN